MANKLTNLVIKEVSLVDEPANPKAHVVLSKREPPGLGERLLKYLRGDGKSGPAATDMSAAMAPFTKALEEALAAIPANTPDADRAAAVKSTLTEFSAAVSDAVPGVIEKSLTAGLTAVQTDEPVEKSNDGDDPMTAELRKKIAEVEAELAAVKSGGAMSGALVALAKMGRSDAASHAEWYGAIQKRAANLRKPTESEHQAFAHAITSDSDARALFRAERASRHAAAIARMRASIAAGGLTADDHADNAFKEITQAATKIQSASPALSPQQAFAVAVKQNPTAWSQHRAARRSGG